MPSPTFPPTLCAGSARTRVARPRLGLLLLAVVVVWMAAGALGCDGGNGRSEGGKGCHGGHDGAGRFELGRARMGLMRTDSRTGRVWLMQLNGDGGWIERGSAPDLGGSPARDGRFEVVNIGPLRVPVGRSVPSDEAVLLRFDRDTGRTWLLMSEDDETWTPAGDTDAPPDVPLETIPRAAAAAEASRAAVTTEDGSQVESESFPVLGSDDLDQSPEMQQKLLETLSEARAKAALPYEMRVWSVQQLAGIDPDLAVPELLKVLDEDEDPVLVAEAIRALGKIGRPSTLPRILALSQHPDERVRSAVSEVVQEVD